MRLLLLAVVFSPCLCVVGGREGAAAEGVAESVEIDDAQVSLQISESTKLVSNLNLDAEAIIKQAADSLADDWKPVFDLLGKLKHAVEGFNASLRKFDSRLSKQNLLIEGLNIATFPSGSQRAL